MYDLHMIYIGTPRWKRLSFMVTTDTEWAGPEVQIAR